MAVVSTSSMIRKRVVGGGDLQSPQTERKPTCGGEGRCGLTRGGRVRMGHLIREHWHEGDDEKNGGRKDRGMDSQSRQWPAYGGRVQQSYNVSEQEVRGPKPRTEGGANNSTKNREIRDTTRIKQSMTTRTCHKKYTGNASN